MKKRLSLGIGLGLGALLASAGSAQADIPGCPPGVQDVTYCQAAFATLASDNLRARRNGGITFRIGCAAPAVRHCRGFLYGEATGKINRRPKKGAKRRRTRRVTVRIPRTEFDIPDGQTQGVDVKLGNSARKRLLKARIVRGELTIVAFTATGQAQITTTDFSLRRPKRRRHRG